MKGAVRIRRLPLPIETPRLRLRLPTSADVPGLRDAFLNPLTARAVGAPLHSQEEMRDPRRMIVRTRREYREGTHLSLNATLRENGQVIGRVGLRGLDWTYLKVESLSYWIDPRYWRRGYASEASWYLCRAGFRHLGLNRISSQALEPNHPSRRVLERLGFQPEGRERESVIIRGVPMDMMLFGLLRHELSPAARAGVAEFSPSERPKP